MVNFVAKLLAQCLYDRLYPVFTEPVYLGSLFTDNSGKSDLEGQYSYDLAPVQHRLKKAHKRYCGMYSFFSSRASVNLKVGAFFAFVYPVATWGSETWTDTAEVRGALDVWFRNKLRRMLGTTLLDHITNDELHSRTISTPLSELIRDRRLRYLGHIVRYPAHRWVRVVLNGEIGSFTGDSAKKTWVKTLQADLRGLHAEYDHCLDRQRWRDICSGKIVLRAIDRAPQHLIRYEGRNRRRSALGQNAER